MIAKLQNPAVAAGLGLMLSIGMGVFMCVRTLGPVLEQAATAAAAAHKEPEVTVEMKEKGWDFWTIEIDNLSTELKEERARLRKQSDTLDQRTARLAAEEKELAKVRSDVEALRKEIADKVTEITADEAKNLKTLAQTYTNLSPRAAVAILREMDDNTVVKILFLMKTDIVAPIFEQMSQATAPDGTPLARRAAVLSERLRLMKAAKQPATS